MAHFEVLVFYCPGAIVNKKLTLNRIKNFLKRMIFPVTPMVVIAAFSLIITIWAFLIIFTTSAPSALLPGISLGISQFIFAVYIIDRVIVKKVTYKQIFFGEIFFMLFLTLSFFFAVSTIDLNVSTNKNYFLVLFDSKENQLSDFNTKGIFGKELNIDKHIIHVDSSLHNTTKFRIRGPNNWSEVSHTEGKVDISGHPINYILRTQNIDLTIDDLLAELE